MVTKIELMKKYGDVKFKFYEYCNGEATFLNKKLNLKCIIRTSSDPYFRVKEPLSRLYSESELHFRVSSNGTTLYSHF